MLKWEKVAKHSSMGRKAMTDYSAVGLKVGLEKLCPASSIVEEIHQQLATRINYSVVAASIIRRDEPDFNFMRKLRLSQE